MWPTSLRLFLTLLNLPQQILNWTELVRDKAAVCMSKVPWWEGRVVSYRYYRRRSNEIGGQRPILTASANDVGIIWSMKLTLRQLMLYIYIYIYMEHLFLMFLDHTQRRTTVGRTPLDEWSARRTDLYLTTHDTHNRQISMPPVGFETTISAGERQGRWPAEIVGFESHRSMDICLLWVSCFVR